MKQTAILALIGLMVSSAASAQTASTRDTATAYGARLNAKERLADLNSRRVNDRITNRIDSRLALRIERYTPQEVRDPVAAYRAATTDRTRLAPLDNLQPAPGDFPR